MPRPRKKNPAYRLHAPTGQAVVTLRDPRTGRRRDFYLGQHDTPASHAAYAELLTEFHDSGGAVDGRPQPLKPVAAEETVFSLFVDFWKAEKVRRGATGSGKLKPNMYSQRLALKICRSLCGDLSVRDFGPLRLQQVREAFIIEGGNRDTINKKVKHVVAAFRWGVSQERVPIEVLSRLETVPSLRRGEADVPESGKVKPVDLARVEAVRPLVSETVRAMIDVQRYTGARGGEVVKMRPVDIDTSGEIWVYTPESHKTAHHEHRRTVVLGPKAQAVVEPFLRDREAEAFLFSPAEAEAARHAEMRAKRQSPLSVNKSRDARRAACKGQGKRAPKDHYTTDSYRRAIQRACDKAYPPPEGLNDEALKAWQRDHRWSPHRLRHTVATEIRRTHGLEVASLLLGHSSATITDAVYAERDRAKVEQAILAVG